MKGGQAWQRTLRALAALALGLACPADAQTKVPTVGFLTAAQPRFSLEPFRESMRRLGYVEGRNITLEPRTAVASAQLDALAVDLVRRKVDVIVAGGSDAVEAAKRATGSIPIVMTQTDVVASGFVANLARPEGNITGTTSSTILIGEKRIELIREVLPKATRVAVLVNPANPIHRPGVDVLEKAGRALGLEVTAIEVSDAKNLDAAFRAVIKARADAFLVLADNVFFNHRTQILEFASRSRLPSVYWRKEFVETGGLISYGVDNVAHYRRAAVYVDKILKGAKPGELPVQQPTELEVAVNLKAAKALGITIPVSVLVRADKVIE